MKKTLSMKKIIATLLLCTAAQAQAIPFASGDPAVGKKLFDDHNCNSCHVKMVGGDGNGIFTRPNHKVNSPERLVQQLRACGSNTDLVMTPEVEQHLGAYLNQKFYKFK